MKKTIVICTVAIVIMLFSKELLSSPNFPHRQIMLLPVLGEDSVVTVISSCPSEVQFKIRPISSRCTPRILDKTPVMEIPGGGGYKYTEYNVKDLFPSLLSGHYNWGPEELCFGVYLEITLKRTGEECETPFGLDHLGMAFIRDVQTGFASPPTKITVFP